MVSVSVTRALYEASGLMRLPAAVDGIQRPAVQYAVTFSKQFPITSLTTTSKGNR